jgi:hypothetical protein
MFNVESGGDWANNWEVVREGISWGHIEAGV